jgi:hypothetical protein
MDNDGQGCQGLCAELFALCGNYSWRQSDTIAGTQLHATMLNEILHFDFLFIGVAKRQEVLVLATSQG